MWSYTICDKIYHYLFMYLIHTEYIYIYINRYVQKLFTPNISYVGKLQFLYSIFLKLL